jgi:undecaprenyl-diphosphatase
MDNTSLLWIVFIFFGALCAIMAGQARKDRIIPGSIHQDGDRKLILILSPAVAVAASWGFSRIAGLWTENAKAGSLDIQIESFPALIKCEWLTKIMLLTTYLGSSWVALPIILAIAFYLYRRCALGTAAALLISVGFGQAVVQYLKYAFHRIRPSGIEVHAIGASFPSGHSFTAMIVYGFIAYLLWQRGHRLKWLWTAGLSFIILIVGASRIYLHAHYFTDVLGGFTLGIAWLAVVIGLVKLALPLEQA